MVTIDRLPDAVGDYRLMRWFIANDGIFYTGYFKKCSERRVSAPYIRGYKALKDGYVYSFTFDAGKSMLLLKMQAYAAREGSDQFVYEMAEIAG